MCGSGWGEGEKATDKFGESNRLDRYSAGLSISSAKSYFWLSDGRFLLRFPSPSPVLSDPICNLGLGGCGQLGRGLLRPTPWEMSKGEWQLLEAWMGEGDRRRHGPQRIFGLAESKRLGATGGMSSD